MSGRLKLEIRVNRLKIIPEAPVNNVQTDAFNAAAAVEHSSGTGPRFSFIIVSYNTLSLTRNAIASICRYAGGAVHEIIVVDNGSTDNSVAVLRGEFPHLRLIELGCNRGFAAANNAGARVARGEWLILLNSDAELLAASLPEVDRLLTQHPQSARDPSSGRQRGPLQLQGTNRILAWQAPLLAQVPAACRVSAVVRAGAAGCAVQFRRQFTAVPAGAGPVAEDSEPIPLVCAYPGLALPRLPGRMGIAAGRIGVRHPRPGRHEIPLVSFICRPHHPIWTRKPPPG